MEEEDLLQALLAVTEEELEKTQPQQLKEVDLFQLENDLKSPSSTDPSAVHNGDTDSSDDESNRNCENQKYNEYGRKIKSMFTDIPTNHEPKNQDKKRVSAWTSKPKNPLQAPINPKQVKEYQDTFLDPIFSMRIVNPKISSQLLVERMQGRIAVKLADLTKQIFTGNLKDKDWVICGVVVNKSPPKTSAKGSQFSIWTLSDLKGDIKTVGLFLFSGAHKDLGTTVVGTVVGVLNPNIMDRRDGSKDQATLSVDTSQKVMIFGQSKDFGTCRSIKKSGEKCNNIVNLSNCEFCIFHMKQEYQKCSKRSELQANFAGEGLVNLRNKVLGKNEVFYAGKSFTAIPAKKSRKLEARDNNIMKGLSNDSTLIPKIRTNGKKTKKGLAMHLDVSPAQRARDIELLKKLGGGGLETKTNFNGVRSGEVSLEESKATALDVISKLKAKHESTATTSTSKYDRKADLFDVEGKKGTFTAKVSEDVSLEDSKNTALSVIAKLKAKKSVREEPQEEVMMSLEDMEAELDKDELNYSDDDDKTTPSKQTSSLKEVKTPQLSQAPQSSTLDKLTMGVPVLTNVGFVDLSKPITSRHVDRAKMNALKYVQRHGPIKKVDPNSTRGTGKKRTFDSINDKEEIDSTVNVKKSKLQESEFISDRFKKMMAMTSRHADLVAHHDDEEKEKYFNKLEVKEKMEDKMANTHKLKTKAVKCLQCKYTSFSASDLCKKERHPLKVCKKFNEIGSKLLSRGFIQLEKRHVIINKRVKSALPRRESERKTHPLARYHDILQGVETRLSMLNMTYMRYIDSRLICFIPGKVLDETKSILDLVDGNKATPRTHQVLQELRDLSSMAIEHFDEHILPRLREKLEQQSGTPEKILKELEGVAGSLTPFSNFQGMVYQNLACSAKKTTRILIHQQLPQALTTEMYKVKKVAKLHQHHINYLTQHSQKLFMKVRKQNAKIRAQAAKLREHERKIHEQNSKIMEQEAALIDIKKHMDEWDQKYKDLTSELVKSREEILLKATKTTAAQSVSFTSNIKPRMTLLPENYFNLDRKRKSTLSQDMPLKKNRSPTTARTVPKITIKIPDLDTFVRGEVKEDVSPSKEMDLHDKEPRVLMKSFFDILLAKDAKAKKRKMTEELELKHEKDRV